MIEIKKLQELAKLIRCRNEIDAKITKIIGRPALTSHVGEYIASQIFKIELEQSGTQKGFDGRFTEGPLKGKTVNIKFYPKRENLLDINPDLESALDYYLVLTGPKSSATSSRGTTRPWVITNVYLFESHKLMEVLKRRGVKIGYATSVISKLWDGAEIYPERKNENFPSLSPEQIRLLELFKKAYDEE